MNQEKTKNGWGGRRPNSGRKSGVVEKARRENDYAQLKKLRAICSWEDLLRESMDGSKGFKDRKMVFDILRYWQDRAEGKPAEQVQLQGPGGGVVQVLVHRGG